MHQTEHELQSSIRAALKQRKINVFRANVGKRKMEDGRWFDTGLPPGFPDLFGFLATGRIFFIEVKKPAGMISWNQKEFLENAVLNNCYAGVARSVDDALAIVAGKNQFDSANEKIRKESIVRKDVSHLIGKQSIFEMNQDQLHDFLFKPRKS